MLGDIFEYDSVVNSFFLPLLKNKLDNPKEELEKEIKNQNKIDWHANRILVKASYIVHTDAIKNIIVPTLTEKQKKFVYADEADVLNIALFGMTAREWRTNNPSIADKGI
jgi:hypothetical protein